MQLSFEQWTSFFLPMTEHLPKITGGISRSEAFAFTGLCIHYEIDFVIDAGTGRGISTEYFACALPHLEIFSIDTHRHYANSLEIAKRLQSYPNVHLIIGDGFKMIPILLERGKYDRAAVFFDGPKDVKAYEFTREYDLPIFLEGYHDIGCSDLNKGFFEEKPNVVLKTYEGWFTKFNYMNEGRVKIEGFPNGPGSIFLVNDAS